MINANCKFTFSDYQPRFFNSPKVRNNWNQCHKKVNLMKDVQEKGTVDEIEHYSSDDLSIVLRDWKIILRHFKKISIDIGQRLFFENPAYRELFPSLIGVDDENLTQNKDFLTHSYAVLRGINSVIKNLKGEFEDKNEILPYIAFSHFNRGITLNMMQELKENIYGVCVQFLNSNKKEKFAWKAILDYIFDNYLLKIYFEDKEDSVSVIV